MDQRARLTWLLLLLSAALLAEPARAEEEYSKECSDKKWVKKKYVKKYIYKEKETKLRLVSGEDQCSGRVEVFHDGKWGTVCDDNFATESGNVVCKQLGCGEVVSVLDEAYFGPGTDDIFLSNVQCQGSESQLSDCQNDGWSKHECVHDEDVSVICSESSMNSNTTAEPSPCDSTDDVTDTTESPTSAPNDNEENTTKKDYVYSEEDDTTTGKSHTLSLAFMLSCLPKL
ncbi:putative DMBT1-like protein [Heliangelus exortis]|uniref:putative DMBT1-like protein n=1 Tax=Heliangelus exortis TaxID=472823 RepID=UPI003A92041F